MNKETQANIERKREEQVQKLRAFLFNRQRAYHSVFGSNNNAVKAVISDLTEFCFVNESCYDADPRMHAVREGRRETFLRIRDHLELTSEQLWEKFK